MKAVAARAKPTFPHVISKRNGRAVIYRRQKAKGGRVYEEFRVATYTSEGKRQLASFASFDEAVKAAELRIEALGRGLVEVTSLTGPARLDYLSATKLLPAGVTLTDAANAWHQSRKAPAVASITVPDAIAAFVESRESATRRGRPASFDYLRDIRGRLGKFGSAFQVDVRDVTAPLIEEWLAETGQKGRSRFNILRLIRTFLRWAQKRGHLPPGPLVTDQLEIAKPTDGGAIEIFTPDELRRLLDTANPEIVPYIALGAFAGARTAEIERLDWSDVKLERRFIEIGAHKAKTQSRRLVPILPALAAWLEPIRKPSGRVVPYADIANRAWYISRDSGVPWKYNGLRHSFITYRIAQIQNVDQVALEAGNSPAMIFAHYRELATPEEASAWFGVMPRSTGNPATNGSRNHPGGSHKAL
ncbi:MAG: tyrosine-type recombinase/integrase [Limisphaerales bacterium]